MGVVNQSLLPQLPPSSIVGRNDDQELLRARLDCMVRGRGSLVLISGEAGIGKTALVASMSLEVQARGIHVTVGHCYDRSATPPYGPWVELANPQHAELLPQLHDEARNDAALEDERVLFNRVVESISNAAHARPLVVVLEDIHWSDPASQDLLRHVARHVDSIPLLLIATYRSDEITEAHPLYALLPLLVRESEATRIDLQRLNTEALASLIAGRYQLLQADQQRLVEHLAARSQGNPLFAHELLRMLEQRGVLRRDGCRWRLDPIQHMQVPPLVRQVIDGRLIHLDPETRSALEVAAVIGQSVPLDLWGRVANLSNEQLDAVVERAVQAHLLEETLDGRGWHFSHALVHDTFYERVMLPRRRHWHRRIAEELAASDDPDAAVLAYHFDHAGDPCATAWHLRAGERSQQLYATKSAVRHFTAVLDANGATAQQQLIAHRSRGRAHETLGEFDCAEQDFEAAIVLARQVSDRSAEIQILLDAGMLWASRNYDRAGDHYRRALDLARAYADPSMLARTLNYLGNWYVNGDNSPDAMRHHREALALFEELDDRRGVAETLDLLGMTAMFMGDMSLAVRYYQRAITLAREIGDRKLLSSGIATLTLAPVPGEVTSVIPALAAGIDWRRSANEALAIAREMGWRAGEAYALVLLGSAQTSVGQFEQALRTLSEVISISTEIGHMFWLMCAHESTGVIQYLMLDLEQAQASIEQAVQLAHDLRAGSKIRSTTALLALVMIELGDLERADTLLRPLRGPVEILASSTVQRDCWLAQSALMLARSQPARALEILDRLIEATPSMTSEHVAPCVARLRARALLALGRPRDAETQLLDGCRSGVTFGTPSQLWRAQLDLGKLYLSQHRYDEADRELSAARATIDALARNTPEGQRRDTFLQRAHDVFPTGARAPSRATGSPALRLSPREIEVLALLVQGSTDQEIADALAIRHRTVTTHVTNIFNKLGVNTRTAAASLAIRNGLV
ncbi:MAG TPA: AAA family ATPase [Thermomicrobiales bacterium]|nr:AAA family ATPase [Thermomicrobiales bacterium]